MQEQLSCTRGVVIGHVSVGVGTDMHVEKKGLAVLDEAVGVLEVGLALADGLDFGPAQSNAGFKLLQQKVVVAGGSIVRGVPFSGGHGVAGPGRLLRAGAHRLNDDMTGLTSHGVTSSSLHRSI